MTAIAAIAVILLAGAAGAWRGRICWHASHEQQREAEAA
jgi:hypothetical protein